MSAFLDVESSLTGRRWVGPDPMSERLAQGLAQSAGLPLPVARILAARGIPPEGAAAHLAAIFCPIR